MKYMIKIYKKNKVNFFTAKKTSLTLSKNISCDENTL